MTNPTAADRIPLARSVHYAVRGMPEVPNEYGPGVLAPSEITLTYRAAEDSQLGRVHAYVAGRIWVDGKERPLLPGGLYGQHYFDGLDGWPEWLAEEARLHDPAAPAVPVAGAGQTADQTALRDRIRRVLCERDGQGALWGTDMLEPDEYGEVADAVLAGLFGPIPADTDTASWTAIRAIQLMNEAGEQTEAHRLALSQALGLSTDAPWDAITERADGLRRLADEAQQAERPRCPHCQLPHELTPGSLPVAVCASTRDRIAKAEQLHSEGNHSQCVAVDCEVTRARREAQQADETPAAEGAAQTRQDGCLFCHPDSPTNRHAAHHGTAYARHDNYPAAPGHIEVLPLRHAASITDLTPTEITDLHTLIRQTISSGDADGWTIGVNEGRAAGRTVDHVHVHLIPRRWGDVPDPRGGVRHVLPGTDPDRWSSAAGEQQAAGARQDGAGS